MDEHTASSPGRDENADAQVFLKVRSDIQAEELLRAEELLDGVEDHCAEWHFLKGAVYYRKGWMDEAQTHYETAARMEPENREYREAVDRMKNEERYIPGGDPFGTLSASTVSCLTVLGVAGFSCLTCRLCACHSYKCCYELCGDVYCCCGSNFWNRCG